MTQVQKNILNRLILRQKFLMMALALAARSTLDSGRHFIEYSVQIPIVIDEG